jgi:hypothetical protein
MGWLSVAALDAQAPRVVNDVPAAFAPSLDY